MELHKTVFADRSERAKLRFTGPQRAWFLHQIMTQSFEDMKPGEAREAAMLTPHGRMVGHMEAVATEDAIFVHFESELRHSLTEAIGKYVFATEVEILDVTDDMGLILLAGPGWEEAAEKAPAGSFVHPTLSLGVPAAYVWIHHLETDRFAELLGDGGYERATERELEAVRIANGIARWGRDMNEKSLPQETGLEGRAVHFDKGCYVGQEAVAKIHFRGKVNRHLRRLEAEGPVEVGAEVVRDGERVGAITSAAEKVALAVLKHTVEPGAVVQVGDVKATVIA